jgi:pectate lyase
VTASGARIVVFRVSGIISLSSRIHLSQPNLTIAGQSAPGGGITLRGSNLPEGQTDILYVETHDVVIRYLRFRYGYAPGLAAGSQKGHNLFIANNCSNIIIDHCSFSWAADENITMWSTNTGYSNITVQYCISSEGFKGHGCGAIIGGGSTESPSILNVDFHHNFFAHNQNRNPLFKGKSARVINNMIYDWDWWPSGWEGGATIDIIGNSYKKGPASGNEREVYYRPDTDYGVVGNPSVYIAGNRGPSNTNPDADNWNMIDQANSWTASKTAPDLSYRRTTPMSAPANPITVHPVTRLDSLLLENTGACARLDQNGLWVANRDAVDNRVVKEYREGTGVIPVTESEVGGFPAIDGGTAYPDADHDGMSDAWETTHGLSPSQAADQNLDADGDGYANVEEFLNGTNPRSGAVGASINARSRTSKRRIALTPVVPLIRGTSRVLLASPDVGLFSSDGRLVARRGDVAIH